MAGFELDARVEEAEAVKTYFVAKQLRKRRYHLQEGEVCRYFAFVAKGLLKNFTVDGIGEETR